MAANNINRRQFTKGLMGAGAAVTTGIGITEAAQASSDPDEFDYIVIGSGAGGGPLAVNLAKAGYSVLILEAGEDDKDDLLTQTPALHLASTEDPRLAWNYYVNHFKDPAQQKKDSKLVPGKGVMYPRGSTVGGSTTINAMVTVYPHDSDFNDIASLTGDGTWDAANMRRYFKKLENCHYTNRPQNPDFDLSHGYEGWLQTNLANHEHIKDDQVLNLIQSVASKYVNSRTPFSSPWPLDVNHFLISRGWEGNMRTPMAASDNFRRSSVRNHINDALLKFGDKLKIRTSSLASRIVFDNKVAKGVEYFEGKHLYKADLLHQGVQSAQKRVVRARKEVIISSGTFNAPQLLMLSGIGPREELQKHNIDLIHELPGVGKNLQDRYEINVTSEMNHPLGFSKAACLDKTMILVLGNTLEREKVPMLPMESFIPLSRKVGPI